MHQVFSLNPQNNFSGKVINPSLQNRKRRLREALHLAQGHTACKRQSWDSKPCLPGSIFAPHLGHVTPSLPLGALSASPCVGQTFCGQLQTPRESPGMSPSPAPHCFLRPRQERAFPVFPGPEAQLSLSTNINFKCTFRLDLAPLLRISQLNQFSEGFWP